MKTVVFCLPGFSFSKESLQSWTNLLLSCQKHKINPILKTDYSPNIYHVRNYCLDGNKFGPTTQKPFQGKLNYDYIMWIDSDIIYKPQDFYSLLDVLDKNQDLSMISGLYLTQDNKHFTVHKNNNRLTKNDLPKNKTKPFKVDSTGFGFTLTRKGVFESLSYPWFQPLKLIDSDKDYEMYLGEDVSFCHRAKQKGFSSYVLPKTIVGHQKYLTLK